MYKLIIIKEQSRSMSIYILYFVLLPHSKSSGITEIAFNIQKQLFCLSSVFFQVWAAANQEQCRDKREFWT